MMFIASAHRNRRARELQAKLDADAQKLASTIDSWRCTISRHRIAFSFLGGGLGGIALAVLPFRRLASLALLALKLGTSAMRAAAWSALLRSHAMRSPAESSVQIAR